MLGKKFTRAKGFSLLELIVYIAILGILLVGVVDLALIIKQSQQKFTANRKVSTDLGNALETIKFLTQSATALPVDNAGKLCEDFHGSQGYNTYYLSLYYNTSSAAVALPYECRGDYNATTTAVKIYWKSSSDRGLWIDCYRGFINGNSGNCTTIQNTGDSSFMLTSAKNTVVYDGGLSFSTTTAYGTSALNISLTMGIPNADHPNYANAPRISATDSRIDVCVIPTNEEWIIARHTAELVA
jgi:prepilin-type N-terminal cleavage/methylation domain-containing protein